jgi:hypothetical protein
MTRTAALVRKASAASCTSNASTQVVCSSTVRSPRTPTKKVA